MHRLIIAVILLLPGLHAGAASPYAGEESRALKALSPDDVTAYLEGRGMGFAKPAELNGYPGPMHVLELAEGMALTDAQRQASRELMDRHKAEVRALGREYIAAETAVERLFARGDAEPGAVDSAVARAATLQARIRTAHLVTHLAQARILTPEQIRRYAQLRGYGAPQGAPQREHRHAH